jgi:hypothetical protein
VDLLHVPLCRHDHGLKHAGGWRLGQPEPGHFVWTRPLGRTYHARRQPITTDLPAGCPARAVRRPCTAGHRRRELADPVPATTQA